MKVLVSIFIIFTIAIRPVLPLVNYAVNYDYIVKNLCENRNISQSTCKGKCYIEKELAKTEKQSNNNQTIKVSGLDAFLSKEIIFLSDLKKTDILEERSYSHYIDSHTSEYFSRIFHPPLV